MLAPDTLNDQVAIVTGGCTGIGLAIATRLGALGAKLVVGSRNAAHLESGNAALRQAGFDPLTVQIDVRKPGEVDEMVERTLRHFGRIDILVNNAAGNFVCKAEDLTPHGWDAVVGIVLNGSFYCSRAVGREMIARGQGGAIVSVLASYIWGAGPGTIHSVSAKAGVMAMTRTLAVEWAKHRIRVNAVAPGPIESEGAERQLWNTPEARARVEAGIPIGRWGKPEEVADAVAFLASADAAFITGDILAVDGGARFSQGTFGLL